MGLLSGILGNAAEIDVGRIADDLQPLLASDERAEHAFQLIRDQIIFTDRRLLFINKQGVTGRKVEYLSVPYRAITRFSIETAGHFDLDAELKIWVSGAPEPLTQTFNRKLSIYTVQGVLAGYISR
ncbi:MAG TPA: PH domain-containing protein [Longimicrobium sp.]|nr:PH domain-containing protein [Longimicrobium sp.]